MSDHDEALRLAKAAGIPIEVTGGNLSKKDIERFYQLCRDKFSGNVKELPPLTDVMYHAVRGSEYHFTGGGASTVIGYLDDDCLDEIWENINADLRCSATHIEEAAPTEGATPETDAIKKAIIASSNSELDYEHFHALREAAFIGVETLECERNELRERVKELEKDAARYWYLRDADPDAGPYITVHRQNSWGKWFNDILQQDEAAKTIDAAIAKEGTKP